MVTRAPGAADRVASWVLSEGVSTWRTPSGLVDQEIRKQGGTVLGSTLVSTCVLTRTQPLPLSATRSLMLLTTSCVSVAAQVSSSTGTSCTDLSPPWAVTDCAASSSGVASGVEGRVVTHATGRPARIITPNTFFIATPLAGTASRGIALGSPGDCS